MTTDYSGDLVLKVNEVFHDIEQTDYEKRHPEIFTAEADRWCRIARPLLDNRSKPVCVLDFGCGTGFVAMQIGRFLTKEDRLVCADISENMLTRCRETIERNSLECACDYVKLNGRTDDWPAGSFDLITLNSVLHHVADLPGFFASADKWLRRGGRTIIGHEPNPLFFAHGPLRLHASIVGLVSSPRRTAGAVLRKLRLIDFARRYLRGLSKGVAANQRILAAVNARLLADGVVDTPLRQDELTAIVDIHSPTAGRFHRGRGVDIHALVAEHVPHWQVEQLETYNHLCEPAMRRLWKAYEGWVARRFPNRGATFLAVLRKP